jgi:hypothetical protein
MLVCMCGNGGGVLTGCKDAVSDEISKCCISDYLVVSKMTEKSTYGLANFG